MFQILNDLYIADWPEAQKADPAEFVRVTVALDSPFKGDYYYAIVDGRRDENRYEVDEAIAKINDLLDGDKKVLVHCVVGRSRSAAVVLGVLLSWGMPFVEAYKFIQTRHPEADPRLSLIEHLL